MIGKVASDNNFNRVGNFRAYLQEIQCYTEENFNTKEKEPNLTFVFNLGDLDGTGKDIEFWQGFVTIPLDPADGIPKMGKKDSRLYKIVSAFYGELFDPKDEKYIPDFGFPKEYDSPDGILAMPAFKDYQAKEPRLKLTHFKIAGRDIIGTEADIKLDYPKKPDGTLGKNIAVVEASPKPKEVARRTAQPQSPALASAPG